MTNEILAQNGAAQQPHNENNDAGRAIVGKIACLHQPMHQAVARYCKPLQIDASTF